MKLFCLLLVSMLLCAADGADALTCTVPERKAFFRKGGPIAFEVQLANRGSAILQGRLEASVLRFGREVSTHVSPEMAIPQGPLVSQMTLPPTERPSYGEGVAVRLKFVSAQGTIALGEHQLGNYPAGGEGFVIGVPRGSTRPSQLDTLREQAARLETLRPALERSAWFETKLVTMPVERAPTQVANWCAFDLVVLDRAALDEMGARQYGTLAKWVENGGRVLIFADGVIRKSAWDFVSRMAEAAGGTIALDERQRVSTPGNYRFEAALGRVLLAANPPATLPALRSGAWREHLAWLWKVRPEWLPEIAENGVWPVERDADTAAGSRGGMIKPEPLLRSQLDGLHSQTVGRPRAIPFSTAALLLGGLLLLAGPVDWWVLGWLRRRKWTWIVFPAFCIGSAWLAWRMAVTHLGPKARELTARVADVGFGDIVLREASLRRRMPANDEQWSTETAEGFSTALAGSLLSDGMGGFDAGQPIPETRVEWLTPSRARLRQNLRQWTINWRQTVSFAGEPRPDAPRWPQLIQLWKRTSGFDGTMLPGDHDGYAIHYIADSARAGPFPTDHIRSNAALTLDEAFQFAEPESPLAEILGGDAPRLSGPGVFTPPSRSPLVILAWRVKGDELLIFRRHVSARELEEAP